MLAPEQWTRIKTCVNEICNREYDVAVSDFGRVDRQPDGSIIIRLDSMAVDLEPEDEDEDVKMVTDGPGWPD